jgi:hypothetical protein
MKKRTLTILACLSLGAISLSAQDLTIANARIIVSNGTVIDRGSIVVRGGKIVSVAAGAPSAPSGKVIDAKGMSAMPGYIDAHKHINTGFQEKEQMQSLLEAGYTTVLSGGGPATATSRCATYRIGKDEWSAHHSLGTRQPRHSRKRRGPRFEPGREGDQAHGRDRAHARAGTGSRRKSRSSRPSSTKPLRLVCRSTSMR